MILSILAPVPDVGAAACVVTSVTQPKDVRQARSLPSEKGTNGSGLTRIEFIDSKASYIEKKQRHIIP